MALALGDYSRELELCCLLSLISEKGRCFVSPPSNLTTVTVQPDSCPQAGSWTTVNAASPWQGVSSGSTTSYVQLASGLCKLDNQVIRFGFPTITIPAGAQVYSVGIRRQTQCVVPPFRFPLGIPLCLHWFRSHVGEILIAGQLPRVYTTAFSSPCPTSPSSNTWVIESVNTTAVGPDGAAWSIAVGQNLADGNFFYDMGRGDTYLNSAIRVAEIWLDVTYQQLSTVTVTAPTGSDTSTNATVQWLYTSGDSQPQQGYQVAIYTKAQTQASGFVPFETTPLDGTNGFILGQDLQWASSYDLTNDSYAAYVQVESQWSGPGSFLSSIGSTTWTRTATGPPDNAILSSAVFDDENNRVALTFAPGPNDTVPTQYFTVYASRNGGSKWDPIPRLTGISAQDMDSITDYDYAAPINVESQYRVIALGGTPLQSAAAPSAVLAVTPRGNQAWLKSPSNPLLNTVLPIAASKDSETGIKITKRRLMGTFQLLSGPGQEVLPFVVSGPTYGNEYQLELMFIEGDETLPMTLWAPVDALDRSGETLLLQFADGTQLWGVTGPGASGQETEETFGAVSGDPTIILWRRRKLTFTPVSPPSFY